MPHRTSSARRSTALSDVDLRKRPQRMTAFVGFWAFVALALLAAIGAGIALDRL